ncbi:MAG: hypothetical protein ACYC40_00200 [Patescibacteria group bacterium]
MKKFLIFLILPLVAVLVFAHDGQSKTKVYYSGDAISFNGDLYISSTNSGSLEILKLENNSLKLISKTRIFKAKFNRYDDFYDSKLSVENNHLFVYAISGYVFYKYEIVNDKDLALIYNQQNTYWEWYTRVDKFNNNIVTTSDKEVKIWTNDLQVIDSFKVSDKETPYNLRSYSQNFILDVQNNHLNVYDRINRSNLISIPLNYKESIGNRKTYQDENGYIYVVDDYYAKKFNLNGKLLGSFEHLDQPGYDVSASGATDYIYFSNGVGVVKLDKDTMKESAYAFTGGLGGPRGWATGLKSVYNDGDKIVVFNNSNILVLNDKLKKLASYTATEEEEIRTYSSENLYLNLNHNSGTALASIELNGGGYFPNEKLIINFGGVKTSTKTDNHGRFEQTLTIPDLGTTFNGGTDIKVDGEASKLSYSISFRIIK